MSLTALSARPGPVSDRAYEQRMERIAALPVMSDDNIRLPEAAVAKISGVFGIAGLAGLVLTLVGVFAVNLQHALAAFEVGLFLCVGASLGALALTMIFHSVNAGWSSSVRRVFEHVGAMLPFTMIGVAVVVVLELVGPGHDGGGVLMSCRMAENAGDHLLVHKAPFLLPSFYVVRFVIYTVLWTFLSWRLLGLSRQQDRTGDRMLGRKARFMCGWGLPAFALSCAFFAFDFMMEQDFRFFSTMWGVYYFAISALAGVSVVALILAWTRLFGRLTGVVTEEHFHDMGKLIFVFTCFWAYIAFSQYFLIWYANIPEETAWFVYRQQPGWQGLFIALCLLHFVVPFVFFVSRIPKRNTIGLGFMAVWSLAVTVMDLIYIVRPMVYVDRPWAPAVNPGAAAWWLDAAGIVCVIGLYGFVLVRRLGSGPLVPIKDPMLHESLAHVNHV